ncbi:hypothetical protein COW36_16890 [bacterium (Candidatus Blackallbacteria) CG17_big_fil_post_rev_8_21_14_2_50_48_46]|uniref:Uncharacterized protein n=1 Tax=bacterium (Candidatus Blackallbacteria) CG17_big_fil_post_rev_8_21_14_2_50_48_46 TaxID=2014261 RepID=A0A2M7G1C7_9BACT|nr:MAG: hypothetical protein COW64_09200 [bacterium (Candidatus Blackallbacteria) CG18_big_fil_WC_8_21_14_2_50_49_26]PIW15480.1 MAG: hypothetical protein COW36_16890 [bacterium (Candidatus Blackallbacteria) CG17_big_fil_post_rev_8_21_14_2_50_48_46]PIW48620.1 MAG: hypothetical protein COW20_08955 [bacterium (Candidatus Blackallbacteria) CG13_big_fil_rev_8_21_14_2_50_49_14]
MEGILALMIPIVAIVVWSPMGKAIAQTITAGAGAQADPAVKALSVRVQALELRLREQDEQVRLLQENSAFFKELLASPHEPPNT